MRKLLILCVMLFIIASLKAQSFMFYKGDQPLEDNVEFTVSDFDIFMDDDDFTILSLESDLHLKNISGNDVQTTLTQTILEGPIDNESGYLSFCFLDCTTGNYNRIKTGSIPANSYSVGFHVNFYAYEGKYNNIKVKYEVYSTNDISKTDKKTVTVTYLYNENSLTLLKKPDLKPVLNVSQEENQVKINYISNSNTCQLEIYNLIGQKIAQHVLASGNGTFSLPEQLVKGVYICVLRSENKVTATKKFIKK